MTVTITPKLLIPHRNSFCSSNLGVMVTVTESKFLCYIAGHAWKPCMAGPHGRVSGVPLGRHALPGTAARAHRRFSDPGVSGIHSCTFGFFPRSDPAQTRQSGLSWALRSCSALTALVRPSLSERGCVPLHLGCPGSLDGNQSVRSILRMRPSLRRCVTTGCTR